MSFVCVLKMWAYFGEIEIVRIVDLLVLVRCVCVCVRACVRACVRVRACECVRFCVRRA